MQHECLNFLYALCVQHHIDWLLESSPVPHFLHCSMDSENSQFFDPFKHLFYSLV